MLSNNRKKNRSGYALLMCLMVVGVTSSIVLTLFNALRLQTAESRARREIIANHALADGALEHALAILIDQPKFEGKVGFQVPLDPSRGYTLVVEQAGGDVNVTAYVQSGANTQLVQRLLTEAELANRRGALGLK